MFIYLYLFFFSQGIMCLSTAVTLCFHTVKSDSAAEKTDGEKLKLLLSGGRDMLLQLTASKYLSTAEDTVHEGFMNIIF